MATKDINTVDVSESIPRTDYLLASVSDVTKRVPPYAVHYLNVNTYEDDTILSAGDANALVVMDKATGVALTIPPSSSVSFRVGTQVLINQTGAGQVTVVAGAGVTINTAQTLLLRAQHSTVAIMKIATDTWVIMGDLEAI